MKGKVLTSWSLIWLLSAVLLVAGGLLNLSQRGFQKLPPTDGVTWVNRDGGIYAQGVKAEFAGSRAGIAVGGPGPAGAAPAEALLIYDILTRCSVGRPR